MRTLALVLTAVLTASAARAKQCTERIPRAATKPPGRPSLPVKASASPATGYRARAHVLGQISPTLGHPHRRTVHGRAAGARRRDTSREPFLPRRLTRWRGDLRQAPESRHVSGPDARRKGSAAELSESPSCASTASSRGRRCHRIERALSQELADVVAYLSTLKGVAAQ